MNTTLQPMATTISLPPISSIDLQPVSASKSPAEISHPLPPHPHPPPPPFARPTFTSIPHSYSSQSQPPPSDYLAAVRQPYLGVPSPYPVLPGRMHLSSSMDPHISIAPSRHMHRAKEVKRRTKTGCMTCRKRRIKVSVFSFIAVCAILQSLESMRYLYRSYQFGPELLDL